MPRNIVTWPSGYGVMFRPCIDRRRIRPRRTTHRCRCPPLHTRQTPHTHTHMPKNQFIEREQRAKHTACIYTCQINAGKAPGVAFARFLAGAARTAGSSSELELCKHANDTQVSEQVVYRGQACLESGNGKKTRISRNASCSRYRCTLLRRTSRLNCLVCGKLFEKLL